MAQRAARANGKISGRGMDKGAAPAAAAHLHFHRAVFQGKRLCEEGCANGALHILEKLTARGGEAGARGERCQRASEANVEWAPDRRIHFFIKRNTRELFPTPVFPSSTSLKWNCSLDAMLLFRPIDPPAGLQLEVVTRFKGPQAGPLWSLAPAAQRPNLVFEQGVAAQAL